MISQFFINRPKFAFVISIVITMVGLISLTTLPVSMFPEITPPQVTINATYPGADAETLESAVMRPIEEQVNGVEGMIYMDSKAYNNGSVSITVTFDSGTDQDIAMVNVQNRVAAAEPGLPEQVRRLGINVRKQSSNMLLGVNLVSESGKFDQVYLSNYASNYLIDPMTRINGVAQAQVMGAMTYSMRVWLNPSRMAALGVTTSDVSLAINEQNAIVPAGQLGQSPNQPDQQFTYTIRTREQLESPDAFSNIIIRANPDGSLSALKILPKWNLVPRTTRVMHG
ncbi:efflux RND transporter permease subunit [Endozoicomonas sp. GU-1]|uniref:efflux RND transporter permease subunit n=1 Tax=Endozoicomonas sp. GU-1 TaxID=3009078 RepID=UPI0022B51504|nr:efflux RND transporter permease subunit [Endozoicomonas sp. GU-1]WBA83189.1 efflux RND transporter permease subunit [Endozoicomonas sp. GU-1]